MKYHHSLRFVIFFFSLILGLTTDGQTFQQEFGNPRKPFVESIAILNHSDSHYALGQPATLRILARAGGVPLNGVTVRYKTGQEMWMNDHSDSTLFVDAPWIFSAHSPTGTARTSS